MKNNSPAISKELIGEMLKPDCPECKEGRLKIKKRKNYPFGRKSKPTISKWKRCPNCGFQKHIK